MGCDIHFVIERKHADRWTGVYYDGYTWPELGAQHLRGLGSRNYEFFGALAGVRRDGPEPLDIPDDASDMARMHIDHWGEDGHSHSYCSLREFVAKRLIADEQDNAAELMRDKIKSNDELIMKTLQFDESDDDLTLDDFRVVFWFDN